MGLVISSLFHIFKWLGAPMLQRLADRIAIGGPVAQKALHTSPELQDTPETMQSTSTAEEGTPTPVAHSSNAASSKAGGSADNPSSASSVALTPADVLEKAPSLRPPDDKGKAPARPSVNPRFYLTDVQIERIDGAKEGMPPLRLTELRVSSKPGQEEEAMFSLSEISSGRWELTEFIPFPDEVEGIQCTIKNSDGEDVASVYLSSEEIGKSGQAGDRRRNDTRSSVSSNGLSLIFWWSVVDTAPMSSPSGSGGFSLKNRRSSGEALLPVHITEAFAKLQGIPQNLREGGGRFISRRAAISMRLFEETGDPTKMEDAGLMVLAVHQICQERLSDIKNLEEAAALRERVMSLWERFDETGDLELIAEAIATQKRVFQLVPEGHGWFLETLHNVSCSLVNQYEHTGDLSDLAEAISTQRRAITLAPDDDEQLPYRLHCLGTLLILRFKRMGDLSDLDEGLSAHQKAVQLGPEDDPNLPKWLNGVGIAFGQRFVLTGELSDLDEAISAQRRAVTLTPEGSEDLSGRLNNLGYSLQKRYETTGNFPCLTEAISALRRSVRLTPEGHPGLPSQFSNLGTSLFNRFQHTRNLSDIVQAVSATERAVDLTPEGHARFPVWLFNLGKELHTLHLATVSWEALCRSLSSYRLAATCTSGVPKVRLRAAKEWVSLLDQHDPRSPDILVAFSVALNLVTLIGGLDQTLQGRHSRLASEDVSGIALEAASAAFMLGCPDKALEWLEQGRCLVWNQLNSLRTPLDSLRLHDEGLVERITKVSTQLEHAGSSRQHAGSTTSLQEKSRLEAEALEHVNLAKEWDRLLGEVRSKPGFETFLQPPTCSTLLQHLPDSGAVVIINVEEKRCDAVALIAGLDEPLHIPLPNFSWEKAIEHSQNLQHRLQVDGLRMRKKPTQQVQATNSLVAAPAVPRLRDVLRSLWVDVVKPILEAMAFTKLEPTRDGPAPRIWWCPTGSLSFLPLHAAGIYDGSSPENVLDYAVSSYTPTVTALADRIRNNRPIDKSTSGLFLTCQPNGIPRSPIPGTVEEVDSILDQAMEKKVRVLKLAGSEVSGEDCLKHMEEYSSVHLACHASQDTLEPLQSRFFFHTGSLELSTILKHNMPNADLAFLSACKTSVGEEKLPDEAVHLAAGMLAAGYRRVIATMWSINDEHATKVAKSFYQYLWDHPTDVSRDGGFDGTLSAYALHHAIQELRRELGDDSEKSILAWAPFIHYGY